MGAVRVSLKNVGASRAAGFTAAAPIPDARVGLATTDADSLVPTTWLVDHVRHDRELMHVVVGTVSVDWREQSAVTQRYERLYLTRAENHGHGHVHGANLGVALTRTWRVGGFRPLQVGEDVDLVARLVGAGAPLLWDSDSAVLTSDRRDCRARGGFDDYRRALAENRARPRQWDSHDQCTPCIASPNTVLGMRSGGRNQGVNHPEFHAPEPGRFSGAGH